MNKRRNDHEGRKRDDWNTRRSVTVDRYNSERGALENQLEQDALSAALQGTSYEYALDVGIGDGRLVQIYASHVQKLLGIDVSSSQLEFARENTQPLNVDIDLRECGDASVLEVAPKEYGSSNGETVDECVNSDEREQLKSDSFDLVVCSRVLQHVADWESAIAEQARVLKPGGNLLLLLYNRYSIYGTKKLFQHVFVDRHKGRFTNPLSIRRQLKRNGMVIDYCAGALMGQPELFRKKLSKVEKTLLLWAEKCTHVFPLKYFGGRQVIRATKL